jgi:hypothetical protein
LAVSLIRNRPIAAAGRSQQSQQKNNKIHFQHSKQNLDSHPVTSVQKHKTTNKHTRANFSQHKPTLYNIQHVCCGRMQTTVLISVLKTTIAITTKYKAHNILSARNVYIHNTMEFAIFGLI